MGYGILSQLGNQIRHIHSGIIKCSPKAPLEQRLGHIHQELGNILDRHRPQALALESIFHAKNIRSVFTLAHARGVAMLGGSIRGLPVYEYSPIEVKRACSGYGRASKDQLAHMMCRLFGLKQTELVGLDQTDALSIALCHLNTWKLKSHEKDHIERSRSKNSLTQNMKAKI